MHLNGTINDPDNKIEYINIIKITKPKDYHLFKSSTECIYLPKEDFNTKIKRYLSNIIKKTRKLQKISTQRKFNNISDKFAVMEVQEILPDIINEDKESSSVEIITTPRTTWEDTFSTEDNIKTTTIKKKKRAKVLFKQYMNQSKIDEFLLFFLRVTSFFSNISSSIQTSYDVNCLYTGESQEYIK